MKISPESATLLCERILKEIVRWPAVDAALQSGGLEEKARGRFETAIVRWLKDDYPNEHFIVLPEYTRGDETNLGKTIDFSLIQSDTPIAAASPFLSVKTLFEVKFNYATQTGQKKANGGEFRSRLTKDEPTTTRRRDAIEQARSYRIRLGADNAYLLYLIAAPRIAVPLPPEPRDSGWEYYEYPNRRDNRAVIGMPAATSEIKARVAMRNLKIGGEYEIAAGDASNPRDCSFYCCLIEV